MNRSLPPQRPDDTPTMSAPQVVAATSAPSFWSLQLSGWAVFWLAMALSRLGSFPLGYMLASKLWLALLGLAASLLLRPLLRRAVAASWTVQVLAPVAVGASYAAAMLWTFVFNLTIRALDSAWLGQGARDRGLLSYFDGGVYHAFALAAWCFLYLGITRHLEVERERIRAVKAEALATAAQLRALQYQLNPHLFFNALNAVSTLVAEGNTLEAGSMIARLAAFMRTVLRQDADPIVSLSEELALVGQYLDIEQERFGSRLTVRVDVGEAECGALVPRLLLQPLVENALRHGIGSSPAPGHVRIVAGRRGARLCIEVENSVQGASGASAGDQGIGLTNTRERLQALYGDNHAMRVTRGDDSWTVEVEVPWTVEHPR